MTDVELLVLHKNTWNYFTVYSEESFDSFKM